MSSDARTTFWDRLSAAYAAHPDFGGNLTQAKAGAMVGLSQTGGRKWEHGGYPSLANTITIAEKLGVCVEWLLTGRGPRTPYETLSERELELLAVFRDMPPIAQESAASMLKLGRTLYFGGDEDRRSAFQKSVAVHEPAPGYKVRT